MSCLPNLNQQQDQTWIGRIAHLQAIIYLFHLEEASYSLSDSIISGKWSHAHLLGFVKKDPDLITDTLLHFSRLFKLHCPCCCTCPWPSNKRYCFCVVLYKIRQCHLSLMLIGLNLWPVKRVLDWTWIEWGNQFCSMSLTWYKIIFTWNCV